MLIFLVGGSILFLLIALIPRSQPYTSAAELATDIAALPLAGTGGESKWNELEAHGRIAKRMKVSEANVIRAALLELRTKSYQEPIEVKVLVLLRVCFACPDSIMSLDKHGGWLSATPAKTNTFVRDMNWPVERRFGHFFLRDEILGYVGSGHDPVKEFDWMATNCHWRFFF
jgi:hypothetical protein